MRRHQTLAGPAFVDDVRKFIGDVDTPAVAPAILEPIHQLVAGVVLKYIDIQLALPGESGNGKVAATQKTSDWIVGVLPVQQVELGVQRVA